MEEDHEENLKHKSKTEVINKYRMSMLKFKVVIQSELV